ncbi:MAG: 4Fe-4S dicluster domain-containing protein [Acidobacteriota bacterium]|nr:MAG: 4Fe-4S dicluster domain-containing protein [Acidobacteriota bacterium]
MTEKNTLQTALSNEIEKVLGCIHCGLCLPYCPTYQQLGNENDSPRGRIYLMRAVTEGRLDPASHSFSRHIDLCLGCRACETACPAGVNYGHLLEAARETIQHHDGGKTGFQKKMLNFALRNIFPHPGRLSMALAFTRFLRDNPLTRFVYRNRLARKVSSRAEFALSLLMTTADGISSASTGEFADSGSRAVSVFTGCVMEGLFKPVNDATKRVLSVNDSRLIDINEQVCCGALHAHSGDLETARTLARRNIDAFESFLVSNPNGNIIINAAGCGALLKEYDQLLHDDPEYAERAAKFSHSVRDVTEYLAQGEIKTGAPIDRRVTFDAPCHLYHAQRVTSAPQQVLKSIPGIEYTPLEGMQDCCGGAGIYNLSEPEMSERLLADKIGKVKATGADLLVTANPGCHMQLGAGLRMFSADCQIAHIVELLDESYRKAGYFEGR